MSHYIDIRLRPDPEFLPHQLMDALFGKLHRQLVELQAKDVGLSFPLADTIVQGLGPLMRLHGPGDRLVDLHKASWLGGMCEMVAVGDVLPVPTNAGLMVVRRVQAKSNPDRVRRRQMKRKGWTAEQAKAAIPDSAAQLLKLPYLTVKSGSTGHAFRLFIRQTEAKHSVEGDFNTYGLSPTATLPMF